MKKVENQKDGERKLVEAIEDFVDEKLNNKGPEVEDTITQENFANLNQNRKKGNKLNEIKQTENLTYKETAPTTNTKTKIKSEPRKKNWHSLGKKKPKSKSSKENIKTIPRKKKYRKDNFRKEALYAPMIYLKKFFKNHYNLNFNTIKCETILGTTIRHMKKPCKLKVYQLLCHDHKNIRKILNVLNSHMHSSKKKTFIYFMTRTYEEIYNRYVSGNIDFPLFEGGIVTICEFITLKKEIEKRENKGETKEKIEAIKNLSLNMIKDINEGKLERKERKKAPFNVFVFLEEFEVLRNMFKADINYDENN